jgi:hypothetical protein
MTIIYLCAMKKQALQLKMHEKEIKLAVEKIPFHNIGLQCVNIAIMFFLIKHKWLMKI